MIKEYPELHQRGIISFENVDLVSEKSKTVKNWKPILPISGDFGIQIARDGRVWVCIDGVAFIRFKPELSIEARWANALRKTWDYIGGDILRANDNKDMPRSHVFEVCVDYVDTHGGLSKEDLQAFRKRNIKKDNTIMKLAFPASRYGF